MCHKVSEGSYYEDPYWPTVQQWCQHNNLPLIGYHYVSTNDPAAQTHTWLGNNGGSIAMLDWEANGGDLSNLTAVVDAFNAAGVTVQLGYYPQWYWSQQGGGNLSSLANALVSSHTRTALATPQRFTRTRVAIPARAWRLTGGATPAAWEFTNSADIAGFTVDCNAYQGNNITVLFGTAPAADDGTTAQLTAAQQHPSRKRRTSPTRKK